MHMAIAMHRITTQQLTNIRTSNGLDILAGLWLVVSPFILGFSNESFALWSTLVSGIVVVALAAGRNYGEGYLYAWPSWVNLLAGIWLILAPFFVGFFSTAALWNSLILGAAVIILSGWGIGATPPSEQM